MSYQKKHCEEHLELPLPVCINSTTQSQVQAMTHKFHDYGSMQKRNNYMM